MINQTINSLLPSCCQVDYFSIQQCTKEEQEMLYEIMPQVKSIMVLCHHITSSMEWLWYPMDTERGHETCGADLHSKNTMKDVERFLDQENILWEEVPYPGISGVRMKDLAAKTNLGELGDNYMFLHREWGPWVHIRVLLLSCEIESQSKEDPEVCLHCGKCKKACPSGAIGDEFNGLACREQQIKEKEMGSHNYYSQCEVCARACPIGKVPPEVKVVDKNVVNHI